jgi:hypothetical protein
MSEASEWAVARQVFPGVDGKQRCLFETVIGVVYARGCAEQFGL